MKRGKHLMHYWKPSRIVKLRRMFDETQEEFARRLRISTPCLQDWEQGKRNATGIATLALEYLEREVTANLADAS